MSERLSIIIPNELKKDLNLLKEWFHLDQSTIIRQILGEGVAQKRITYAIEEYKKQKVTLGKAAEMAGVNQWAFIDELQRQGVEFDYTLEDAKGEIAAVKARRAAEYAKFVEK